MTSILDSIDGALADWSVSADAMRWTSEPRADGNDALAPIRAASVSMAELGDRFLAFAVACNTSMSLAIELAAREQERLIREALMRESLWASAPPAPVSGMLGPVSGDVMKACEETTVRHACWPCQAKAVPGELSQDSGRRRRRLR